MMGLNRAPTLNASAVEVGYLKVIIQLQVSWTKWACTVTCPGIEVDRNRPSPCQLPEFPTNLKRSPIESLTLDLTQYHLSSKLKHRQDARPV